MLRWFCLGAVVLIVLVSAAEMLWDVTPLEQLRAVLGQGTGGGRGAEAAAATIRIGIASWQMDEFPWEETLRRYEEAHPGKVRILHSVIPEGSLNSVLLLWALQGKTKYDVVVAWADEEIHPFIDYNWATPDPARRSLIINVRDYLTPEQLAGFVPAFFGGCSRKDPQTGQTNLYELPWMGEVLALNYNKLFFKERGIERPPQTWEEVEAVCEKLKGLTHSGVAVAPLAMVFAQGGFFAQNCYLPLLAAYKTPSPFSLSPGEKSTLTLPSPQGRGGRGEGAYTGGRGVVDEKGRPDVASPEAVRVFETLKRWHQAGYISPNCMVAESIEQDLRVLRAAMYPHWQSRGLWAVKDHGEGVIGIAPTPGAQAAGSLVCTYGCIIPKCSPVIRQAVDFCYETFCTDTYGFQTAVSKGWSDPHRPGELKGGGKMPVTREMYRRPDLPAGIRDLGQSLEKGYSYPDPVNWGQCAEILAVEFQKYLSGATPTAEEALRAAERRIATEVYAGQ